MGHAIVLGFGFCIGVVLFLIGIRLVCQLGVALINDNTERFSPSGHPIPPPRKLAAVQGILGSALVITLIYGALVILSKI